MGMSLSKKLIDNLTDDAVPATPVGEGGLVFAQNARVWAMWNAGVLAGVVTVRWGPQARGMPNAQFKSATLTFSAGAANELLIDIPVGYVEVEITTAVSGGGSPGVTVFLLANNGG